ncbi:AmmeMemoRadiSam system protein B [Thermodesulfobacteriota bacterium]
MAVTRSADFAGSWYPGSEKECRRTIEEYVRTGIPCPSTDDEPIGGIVPHAGWVFSGKIACNVIKCLKGETIPDTVILFGRHLHAGSRNYVMKEGRWETPFADLEIDQDMGGRLAREFDFTVETMSSYEQDNTIELQLPFITYFFPGAMILPLGVPPASASLEIGERVIELAAEQGKRVIVLGSTDLTHYGYNYGYTPKGVGEEAVEWVKQENDRKVIDLMLELNPDGVIRESLQNSNACCSGAAATAIAAAKKLGATRAERLIYTTSYDIRPDSSFVGYVGIVFY